MSRFSFWETAIPGVYVVEPGAFTDRRGHFMETYNAEEFAQIGIHADFVQDNQSLSHQGVVRGLHYQLRHPQAKLVRAVRGEVFDVGVDLRPHSPTFGEWCAARLSAENRRQLYLPRGFAHGFMALTEGAELAYKCDGFYDGEDEGGIRWDDATLAISWPRGEWQVTVSEKDALLPVFDRERLQEEMAGVLSACELV